MEDPRPGNRRGSEVDQTWSEAGPLPLFASSLEVTGYR